MRIRCINKIRNAKGNIEYYNLEREDGYKFQATAQQIKVEIRENNYEFTNLQIDKAGRLVDKKEELSKTTVQHNNTSNNKKVAQSEESKYYTMEDMIRERDCKDKIVKFYDRVTQKEYDAIGVDNHMNTSLYGCINVYCPETHKEYKVGIGSMYDRMDSYFYRFRDRDGAYGSVGNKENEETRKLINTNLEFINRYNKSLHLAFVNEHDKGSLVDAEPNPNGEYTLLAVSNTSYWFVKNNKTDKVLWIRQRDYKISPEPMNNRFTNLSIKRKEYVLPQNIRKINLTNVMSVYESIKDNINKLIDQLLKNGGFHYTGDFQIIGFAREDIRRTDGLLERLKEKLETIKIDDSIDNMINEVITELYHREGLYYGMIGDCDEDGVYFSYNALSIIKCIEDEYTEYLACYDELTPDDIKNTRERVNTNIQNRTDIDNGNYLEQLNMLLDMAEDVALKAQVKKEQEQED